MESLSFIAVVMMVAIANFASIGSSEVSDVVLGNVLISFSNG